MNVHRSSTTVETDPLLFRHVLGHYPTGVCLITSMSENGEPIGLIVGSFTSASLDPPLVAFFPDRRSFSWGEIAKTGRFCVNILSEHQESMCRAFTTDIGDRFRDAPYRVSEAGLPIMEGALAWIDCDLHSVQDAGDHFVVLGRVLDLEVEQPGRPLLFFRGGYGQFAPFSKVDIPQ